MRVSVYVDFDGTIAPDEPTDALFDCFADPAWREIEKEWQNGATSSRDCMERQIALLRATPDAVDAFLETVTVDLLGRTPPQRRTFRPGSRPGQGPGAARRPLFAPQTWAIVQTCVTSSAHLSPLPASPVPDSAYPVNSARVATSHPPFAHNARHTVRPPPPRPTVCPQCTAEGS